MFSENLKRASILILIVAFVAYANVAKGGSVTEGLVSYWSFDEDSIEGETASDVFGDNDGVIAGEPETVEGKINEALTFDGSEDWVEIPPDDSLDFPTMTFCFWFQSSNPAAPACFFSKFKDGANKMQICNNFWGLKNGGTWATELPFNIPTYFDGDWHYAAAVVGEDGFYRYFDGELVDSAEVDSSLSPHLDGYSYFIGTMPSNPDTIGGFACNITMDEVSIYNRALSEDEIQQNYDSSGLNLAVDSYKKLNITWGKMKSLQ